MVVSRAWDTARLWIGQRDLNRREKAREIARGERCFGGGRCGDLLINLLIIVKPRVTLASVETSSKRNRKLADEAVVRNAQIAQLAGESDEVSNKVGSM